MMQYMFIYIMCIYMMLYTCIYIMLYMFIYIMLYMFTLIEFSIYFYFFAPQIPF